MPNRFYERDGRVVDFMGNDWRKTWGKLLAQGMRAEGGI